MRYDLLCNNKKLDYMKKIGSVNPCNTLFLYDIHNKCIGYCLDTPNAFACACFLNKTIMQGVANYCYFENKIMLSNDVDIISRKSMFEKLSKYELLEKMKLFNIEFYE